LIMKPMFFGSLLALALVVSGDPSHGEAKVDVEEFAAQLPANLLAEIRDGDRARFLNRTAQTLFQLAPDGVLTREGIDLSMQVQAAAERARHLQELLVRDLDGDFQVSRKEFERQFPLLDASTKARMAVAFAEHDSDQNGILTLPEMKDSFEPRDETRWGAQAEVLMAFDLNQDGKVDLAELSQVVAAVKPDGRSGTEEIPLDPTPVCALPPVPAGDEVVLVSGYSAAALSTVALLGQDVTSYSARLTVEEGDTPLYVVVASFDPIVWRFEGATKRIRTLVVQASRSTSGGPGTAVAGLEKDKIHFVESTDCFGSAPSRNGTEANGFISNLVRILNAKVPSRIVEYYLTSVAIPSGKMDAAGNTPAEARARYANPVDVVLGGRTYRVSSDGLALLDANGQPMPPATQDRNAVQDMIRIFPAGIASFDPATLVAPGPVETYDILPGPVGLLQLMADGKIEALGGGKYRVVAPIDHFPAGLAGPSSSIFLFADGIPSPNDKD
jgi:EF hand